MVNAVGNCRASLGDWRGAREEYLESAALFQTSKGGGGTAPAPRRGWTARCTPPPTPRSQPRSSATKLPPSASSAPSRGARQIAPTRAALAALLYASGRVAEAEEQWEQACTRNVGCGKYRDMDYVARVRSVAAGDDAEARSVSQNTMTI